MRLTKGRIFIALALVALTFSALRSPSVAHAGDNVPGRASGSCVKTWVAYDASIGPDLARVDIAFHLEIRADPAIGVAVVQGNWSYYNTSGTNVALNGGSWWRGPGSFVSSYGVAGGNLHAMMVALNGAPGMIRYRLTIPAAYGDAACFVVSNVVVHREFRSGGDPGPGNSPGFATPTPTVTPSTPASEAPGWCDLGGGVIVPCVSPPPTPSPSPSPTPGAGCPFVAYGSGTFTFPGWSTTSPCFLWRGFPAAGGTVTFTWSTATVTLGGAGSKFWYLKSQKQSTQTNPSVLPSTLYVGTNMTADLGGGFGTAPTTGSLSASSVSGTLVAGYWHWVGLCAGSATNCGGTPTTTGMTSWTLTVAYTGTWLGQGSTGAPTPSPSPSPPGSGDPGFCAANPDVFLCASMPPWWATPGPGDPGNGGLTGVEICDPSSAAYSRVACAASFPPNLPEVCSPTSASYNTVSCAASFPPQPDAPEVCDPGSPSDGTVLCSTFDPGGAVAAPSLDLGGFDQVGAAYDDLGEEMAGHAPFSWAGEVAGALDPSSYAGADIAWCFDVLGAHICVDPYAVTAPIAGYRSVFLGLLGMLVAWAVAHRVWATVGGTPAAPDA